jgi:hypothetical protein
VRTLLVGGDTGGKAVRGISGGERRRLAIACETLCLRHSRRNEDEENEEDEKRSSSGSNMASEGDDIVVVGGEGEAEGEKNPTAAAAAAAAQKQKAVKRGSGGVILADEPTTGLDAHQADKIVEKLGETARVESAAVVCVLHQPRSAIFEKLDDLMLLAAGGRVAYLGPASNALDHFRSLAGLHKLDLAYPQLYDVKTCISKFALTFIVYRYTLGHACPQYYNPAEFLIDLVAVVGPLYNLNPAEFLA